MNKHNDGLPPITEIFEDLIPLCVEKGMQPPFLLAAMAFNGSCMFGRLTQSAQQDAVNLKVLSSYGIDGGLWAPLYLMLVDANGASGHFGVGGGGAICPLGPILTNT